MTTRSVQDHINFRIEEVESSEGKIALKLHGQLDAEAAAILAADLESRLEYGVRTVALDFFQVDFISSSGVGSLVVSVSAFRSEGGDVVLQKISESVHSIFEMLGLTDFLTFE